MAITEIRASKVALTRTWVNPEDGKMFFIVTAWEPYLGRKGEDKNRRWSIWFDVQLDIAEGDLVDVTGDLATKPDLYQKDGNEIKVVAHSLENPVLLKHDTTGRRGGDLHGQDQDDVLKYGNPVYRLKDESPF
jgi:hypothetical protein